MKTLKNSDCPFRFLFEDFRLCSRDNNVNYGALHVYKPLFRCSVAISRLACFEIPLSMNEKKLEKSPGKGQTCHGVTALAQLYTLYSHTARSFNQWQRALYPNFIIRIINKYCRYAQYCSRHLNALFYEVVQRKRKDKATRSVNFSEQLKLWKRRNEDKWSSYVAIKLSG